MLRSSKFKTRPLSSAKPDWYLTKPGPFFSAFQLFVSSSLLFLPQPPQLVHSPMHTCLYFSFLFFFFTLEWACSSSGLFFQLEIATSKYQSLFKHWVFYFIAITRYVFIHYLLLNVRWALIVSPNIGILIIIQIWLCVCFMSSKWQAPWGQALRAGLKSPA